MMNLSKFGICFVRTVINKTGDLSTEIAKFLFFFVGALRIYHLFRCQ